MNNATKYELGKICTRLSSGKNIVAKNILEQGKYPVYGANGLRGYTDNYNFDGECAIVGRQGAYVGNVHYFSGKAYMSEHAVVAQPDENHNARYLAYYLSLIDLSRLSGQSAQPGLSVQTLSKEYVFLPSLENQNKVSKLLGDIDDKISKNKQINDNLVT